MSSTLAHYPRKRLPGADRYWGHAILVAELATGVKEIKGLPKTDQSFKAWP